MEFCVYRVQSFVCWAMGHVNILWMCILVMNLASETMGILLNFTEKHVLMRGARPGKEMESEHTVMNVMLF